MYFLKGRIGVSQLMCWKTTRSRYLQLIDARKNKMLQTLAGHVPSLVTSAFLYVKAPIDDWRCYQIFIIGIAGHRIRFKFPDIQCYGGICEGWISCDAMQINFSLFMMGSFWHLVTDKGFTQLLIEAYPPGFRFWLLRFMPQSFLYDEANLWRP